MNQFAALQEMVTAENRGDLFKTNEELGRLSKIWIKGGAEALEREGGLAAEQARDAANLFSELREAGRTVGEADEATPDDMSDERAERFGKLSEDYVSGRSEAAPTEGDLAGFGFTESGAKAWLRWAGHERNVRLQIRALVEGGMIDRAYAARHAGAGAMAGDLLRVRRSMEELDFLRRIWADASKGVRMTSKDGRTISDPGARALEEQGFTKEAADRLSLLFHRERAAAYSKAALDGVRALYDAKTRGKVDARAAMAARFGGRFQRIRTGTDERGNATWGDFIAFTAKDGSTSLVEFTESSTGAPDFSRADASAAESIAQATGNAVTAETWMNATPEERARIWNERGLRSEGDFVAAEHPVELSVPGDPRARVSSTQAARIVGRITVASESAGAERRDGLKTGFQAVIDNSAAFHETFHAFSHFAETSGLWSEEDLKHLRERFGDPAKGVRERFNEETGAEAFRAFNVRRMDGALTEEDQRGPFMKLASLAHGLLRASEEAAAKSRRARTAEDALFDQIMLDRYSSVPDFGAEEERRKSEEAKRRADEEGRKAPPPRTASPAKDGAAPETTTGNAPADGNDGSAGGSPADANGKAGSGNGTPAPANGAPKRWTAYTPTGNVKVSGHWRVFDLKELVHSNNPLYRLYMRAQLRDRKDNKAEEDTRNEIVNNFQGERLLDAPDTANGAPIVFMAPDENGVVRPFVLSGNGRVLVLNELEARHLFDRYRETMKRWCAENGVSVPEGETPVLVRVVDDLGGESRERVADLSNTNSIQQYNEEEQARADAEVVRAGNLARLYVANEDGTPNMNGANDEFFSRFVAAVGDTSLYNSDRTLTQKAVQRAQRALMAVACGQGTRGRDVVKKLVERSDTLGIRRQKNAVAIMAAPVAASEAKPEYAVGPDVSRAVADFMDFTERKAAGKVGTIGDYMAEQDMLEPRSEVADGILGLLASPRAAAEIAAYVKTYCDAAAKEDPSGGLFGAARTKNEIWRDAVKTVDERLEKEKAQSERRRLSVAAARHDELMRSSAEYRDVYDRYHDADGSAKPGWLKAPNGRDTNLEPYQWVQVRTPSFMRWFGDWMAAAETAPSSMDDAKVHFKRLMASKAELRTADGNVLRFASQSAKAYSKAAEVESANRQAHWCAIANIEQFVVRSRFMYEEKPRNGSSDILSYVKYGCVFTFGGDRYLAKITSKKYPGREQQNFYTVESVSVKKIVARGIHEAISKGQPLDANDESRIARILEGVNADSSKIVDENGEPLVVYHNSKKWQPLHEPIGKAVFKDGPNFFGSSKELYDELSQFGIMGMHPEQNTAYFINVRNPLIIDAKGGAWNNIEGVTTDDIAWREYDKGIHDGVIIKNVSEFQQHEWRTLLNDDEVLMDDIIPFSPTQIKSATDNNGDFSRKNDDVRYSIAARLDEERRRIEAAGGRLLLAHHGTDSRGFTMFDRTDDVGYFFAKTRNTAASYIRKGNREDENEPGLPRMEDVEEYLKDEASGYSEEEVSKMSYPEKIEAYIEGTDARSGIYDVALKMENPYEIDCHGANWDAIYDVDENPETRTYDHVNVSFDAISGELKLRTREYGEDEENVETFDNLNDFFRAFKEKFGSEFGTDLEEIEKAYSDEEDFDSDIVDGRPEKGAYGALFTYNNYDESGWFLEPKRTRDIVAEAKDMGCDGVIFHNVEDSGGGVREATVDDVYVVMDPEQVKLVDDMTYDDDGSIVPAEKRLDWSNPDMRFSIANLYTGGAADYEKPSLHYVGTGEGAQVYGWGLYASNQRGVAENYAKEVGREAEWKKNGKPLTTRVELLVGSALNRYCSVDLAEMALRAEAERGYDRADELRELREHGNEYKWTKSPEYVYEQTFFTNRAPGDESHLLNWYEPVSEENLERILEGLKKEGVSDRFKDMYWLRYKGMSSYLESNDIRGAILDNGSTGDAVYQQLTSILGGPKAASEFLARADIDGVKYPVDSYGGKDVKDGDEAGWNYVSFRDDNIRVDHKWVDGQRRFSFAIGERGGANLADALFVAADLSKAREMLAGRDWDKLSRDEKVKIKLATSWEKGADGKWRREVPDMPLPDMAKLKVANPLYSPMDQRTARANPEKADRYRPVRLEELFKKKDAAALELFGAYPWLRRQIVVYGADARLGNGMRGAVVSDGSILISEDLRRTPDDVRSTLTHEIQHKIQEHEDHARGGSSAGGRAFLLRKYQDASKAAEAWYGKIEELVRAEDGKSVANDYESDYRIWRYHRLRYVAMKASDPRVKAATSRLESLPGWKEVESERKAFRAKYGHEPKFFLGSVFDAERYASGGAAEVYRHMAGEVEARAMQRRIGMTEAQRVANLLMEDSEDVARKDQILLGDALGELEKAVQAESPRFSVASPLVDAMRDRERRALGPREPRGASPYFSDAAGAMDFPVRALRTLKDEPESSVENAAVRMGKSARGEIRKRAPIAVADNGDGTYTVVDGNATVWAAARGGLETVRAVVVGKNTGTRLGNSVYMVQDDASGCDLPVNGKMRLRTHGLDGLEGEAARERAYEQAEENVPLLKSIVNAVAARDGTEALFRSPNKAGPGTDPREVGKEVKKRSRVDEKARNDYKRSDGKPDYSRVVDLIGGTLVLKDTDAFDEAIGHLRQEAARQGASIAQVKKLNMEPGAKGYQDVKVSIRFANGGIGEVIVVGDYMNDAKFNRGGHVVYDASRVLEPYTTKAGDAEIDRLAKELEILSNAIYDRGSEAPDAESFASMKASASSSLTRFLGNIKDEISSRDINTLKEALSEFHLAKPPSVDSYAMPARSFIQNDISNSFSGEEKTKRILSESSLTVNGKSDNEKSFSSAFHHPDAMSDEEAAARRSIRAMLADGGEKEAKSALENYVAYFELSHGGVPRRRTLARMGLAMGMKTVSPDELLRKGASIAEQMRGTLIERAARNGDVSTTLALLKREKDMDAALDDLVAGAAGAGGTLTHKGVGRVNDIINRRVEQLMRDFSAASLADMEGETGLDIAAEILANDPNAFDGELKKAKGIDPDAAAETAEDQSRDGEGGDEEEGDGDGAGLTDRQKWEREQLRREAEAKVARFIADAKARAAERKAAADRLRQKRTAESGDSDGGGGASGGTGGDTPSRNPLGDAVSPGGTVRADFRTPREFAAFLRVWAADKFARTHGLTSLGKAEENRLFAEFYRICARRELNDLAQKLLAPKGARAWVNRRLQDLEKGVRPDTVERISADVFAFINKAAIRESRAGLVKKFKNDLKERYFKGTQFDQFRQDADRRVTGWVEEAARYICRVCDLSRREINGEPSQLQKERAELRAIIDRRAEVYDESGKDVAQASVDDAETRKALWKLALLDKFGAMTSLMPGEILDLQDAAFRHLETQAADLEAKWKETRELQERIRGDLTAAVVAPNGRRYQEKGWLNGRLFDALNGLIRLRLRHLTRFAPEDARKKAEDSINEVLVMLGDGETLYARALQDDRAAFFAGLAEIFRKPGGGADNGRIKKYLARMEEPIPEELSKRLSNQGFAGTMTYGQMLQLLVSLEQRSFKDAVKENGREGQVDLIRNYVGVDEDGNPVRAFTAEDERFIAWLRAFYEAKRETISKVTERMVGQRVDSPDPLYCPVRRLMDDRARGLHSDPTPRWDPIAKVFSRRVDNLRDFDETRSIVSMFFEASEESAKLVAWAERGSIIRNVFTSVGVQSAIQRAFGPGELGRILRQLEATFNGGESRQRTPGELAAVDKVMNFTTYAYLGFNPLSAMKQTTSFTVWANALPGGFKDLWRHMTHFDASVVRHLMESDEYKVRYGNDVGSGQDAATKGVYENPSLNPVARIFSGAGMWLLKKGDFVPGIWIAQGVYKDMLNRNLQRGMSYEEADRRAVTETFNMLEETQQSGRTYNTNALSIEHGRIGRLLTQFATSPLQQLQYETQAWREWRDMVRYGMGEKRIAEARGRFLRAVVINHVLIPAALELVISAYRLALGEEPPWEKEGAHWDFLVEILLGQFGRVFMLGAFAKTTLNAVFKRQAPRGGELLPSEGILGMAAKAGFMVHDFATCDVDRLQKDLEGIARGAAATRTTYNIVRRFRGDSDEDRKSEKAAKKAARGK